MATWKCFDRDRRLQLQALYLAGHTKKEMAAILGCSLATIYNELKRGQCLQLDSETYTYYSTYSADLADLKAKEARSNCGRPCLYDTNDDLLSFIQDKILLEKRSPGHVSMELRSSDLGYLSKTTIYRYIHRNYFSRLRSHHLPEVVQRKRPVKRPPRNKDPRYGASIELRPSAAAARSFGHWEMDTVIGKRSGSGETLLVLTERATRAELIFKLGSKSSHDVVAAIDRLQKHCTFKKLFKSITMDNGTEFAATRRLEFSAAGRRRTYCYYCHPYSSYERGSNENANKLIRRWFPKGRSLSSVTPSDCVSLGLWMNTLRRESLHGKTSSELFLVACERENIRLSDKILNYFLT